MRNVFFIITFGISFCTTGQQGLLSVNLEGGLPILSSKIKTIKTFHSNYSVPKNEDWIRPHHIWNTSEIGINFHLKKLKGLSIALGIRMFQFGWEVDTISVGIYYGSISTQTGTWKTHHGRREAKLGYILPTIGATYNFVVANNFSIRNSLSLGISSFANYDRNRITAYGDGQDALNYNYSSDGPYSKGHYDFDYRKNILDFKVQSAIEWKIQGFSIFVGPSFYAYRYKDRYNYNGLHLNGGMSYRFYGKK
jgi:hypothetical protein